MVGNYSGVWDNGSILPQINENIFLNADSDKKNAVFDYEFQFDKDVIKYSYEKSSPKTFEKESLYLNGEVVFAYNFDGNIWEEKNLNLIGVNTLNFEYMKKNLSIVRYIANNTTIAPSSPIKKLMDFVNAMRYLSSTKEGLFIGSDVLNKFLTDYVIEHNLIEGFSSFLKEEAQLDLTFTALEDKFTAKKILMEIHGNRNIPFVESLSSGTAALLSFYCFKNHFLEKSLMFIDEFDAYYHHELAQRIVQSAMQYENAQVLFTSHNTYLASNNLMRPDCYFVIKKDSIKPFSELTHRELREAHNLEKMYRSGEFDE